MRTCLNFLFKNSKFLSKPLEFGGPAGGIINYLHDIFLYENAYYNHLSSERLDPL